MKPISVVSTAWLCLFLAGFRAPEAFCSDPATRHLTGTSSNHNGHSDDALFSPFSEGRKFLEMIWSPLKFEGVPNGFCGWFVRILCYIFVGIPTAIFTLLSVLALYVVYIEYCIFYKPLVFLVRRFTSGKLPNF